MKSIKIVTIVCCVVVAGSAWTSPLELDAQFVGRGFTGLGWFNDGAVSLLTSPSANAASGIGPAEGQDAGFEGRGTYADLGDGYRFYGALLGAYGDQTDRDVSWGITLGLGQITNGTDIDAFGASAGVGLHVNREDPYSVLAGGVRVSNVENGFSDNWWDLALGYYDRHPGKFQWGVSVVAVDVGGEFGDTTFDAGFHGRIPTNSWLGFGVDFRDITEEYGDMLVNFGAEFTKLFSGVQVTGRVGMSDNGSSYDPTLGLGARFSRSKYGIDVAWADGSGSSPDLWIVTLSAATGVIDNLLSW